MSLLTQPKGRPLPAEWRMVLALSVGLVLLASVPYMLAYRVPSDHVFSGFLFNPVDGNSYFAKMRQGLRGEWLFTLPYTAEPGEGVFLYSYYLFLGHMARWTGASLDVVYHGARLLGGLALLLAAYAVVARFFETRRARLAVWALYALGSGLGWLAVPFGGFPPDLWVAEAIPFLSLFTNAHFGPATALLFVLILWTVPGVQPVKVGWPHLLSVALATTVLAQVQPLALLNVGLLLAGVFAWCLIVDRPRHWGARMQTWAPAVVFGVAALPWLIQASALMLTHPVLAQWNAQNETPSPPLWETVLAGGVLLVLAVPGIWRAVRRRTPLDMIALLWLGLGALALYAPFSLQRRLSLGLWMPLALLAGLGLRNMVWPRVRPRLRPLVLALLILALLPSNLLVYAATLGAVADRQPDVFLTREQSEAIDWLAANAGRALVAAPPEMGVWIPARSDARVIYGHPYETVDADRRKAELESFYQGRVPGQTFVHVHNVRYVLLSPNDQVARTAPADWAWPIVFQSGRTVIYAP